MRPQPYRPGWVATDLRWGWPVAYGGTEPRSGAAAQLRIGDAERDQAVSRLGDHFAAGRLTQDELEQRMEQAMQARTQSDLDPLFADLPGPREQALAPYPGPPFAVGPYADRHFVRSSRPPLLRLGPVLLVLVVVAAVVLSAPWLLWMLFWVFVLTGFHRHRRPHLRR